MSGFKRLSRMSRSAIVVTAVTLSLVLAGVAIAAGPAIQTITPHRADQITNLDVLRQQIKNYYGDPLAVTGSELTGGTWQSPLNLDSNYAKEAESVANKAEHWLAGQARKHGPKHVTGLKAIVLDVDDTTLTTWNYEIFSNWDFNPATNGQFVTNQAFPATPGMVAMVTQAAAEGYAIIFITGRPAAQEADTLGNLTHDNIGVDAGYPAPTTLNNLEDGLFTKPAIANYPPYLLTACAAELALVPQKSCTTIHYKSATRAHIESLGYDIVASFGDQFSDLTGGFADKTFKMPNPNYFLP
jgi:predicted secreted acid phosphatase